MSFLLKLLGVYYFTLDFIFFPSFFQISVVTVYCKDFNPQTAGLECYSSLYFIHFVAGLVILLGVLVQSTLSAVLFKDFNPFSLNAFARPWDIIQVAKWLLKFVVAFLYAVDQEGVVNTELAVVVSIYLFALFKFREQGSEFYDQEIEDFQMACEIFPLWVFCCNLI